MSVLFTPKRPVVLIWPTRLTLVALACAGLSACGSFDGATTRVVSMVTPYKVEVVQGNFVSKEQVQALQAGMSRSQVRDILGSPLITSAFHTDRWDYVFTIRRQGIEAQKRKLTVFFKGDLLDKFESDAMPSEAEFVAQLDSGRALGKVPLLEVPEEVLKEFGIKNANIEQINALAAARTAQAAPNTIATRVYPPLEAPGASTSAWDASTQRAVASAAASAPTAPQRAPAATVNAPFAVAAANPPVRSSTPAVQQAPVPAPIQQPAQTAVVAQAPAAAPVPRAAPAAAAAPTPVAAPVPAPVAVAKPAAPVTAPVAAAAPVAAPQAPVIAPAQPNTRGFSNIEADISTFLALWQNDWQTRNATAYFSHYAPEFKGTSTTRAEWEALRRARIENRAGISLGVFDVRSRMVSPTEARVVFRQSYESDAIKEIGTKAMFLVKRDGRWLIEREFFTPAQ